MPKTRRRFTKQRGAMHNGKPSTSQFRGVCEDRSQYRSKPWRATIVTDRKPKYLGWFATEAEAAQAYADALPITPL